MVTKKELSRTLSKLKGFENPEVSLEQYLTPSEISSQSLWFIYMQKDIKGKIIADLGAGTGILGIGALILGAKKVYFVDKSLDALELAKSNLSMLKIDEKKAVFVCDDVKNFDKKVDVVIQNPPFGVKRIHADREFLEKAIKIADRVYSFHKIESREFIDKFSNDNQFKSTLIFKFKFPLKWSYEYHKKPVRNIIVGIWKLEKNV